MLVIQNSAQSAAHGAQSGLYENHGRLLEVLRGLRAPDLASIEQISAVPVREDQLQSVHSPAYVEKLARTSRRSFRTGSQGLLFGEETIVYPGSFSAALSSAGAAITAVNYAADALKFEGRARNFFCACRSAGHHAQGKDAPEETAMGFCLLSNAALAARHAQLTHHMRVAVFDFDAHDGNGTEWALRGKRGTFFAEIYLTHSQHEYPYSQNYIAPAPAKNILKIALKEGTTATEYRSRFERSILPAIRAFGPDLLVCSAGFDCMQGDPLGGFRLQPGDMYNITAALVKIGVPVVSILEGGYHYQNLYDGVRAHISALKRER